MRPMTSKYRTLANRAVVMAMIAIIVLAVDGSHTSLAQTVVAPNVQELGGPNNLPPRLVPLNAPQRSTSNPAMGNASSSGSTPAYDITPRTQAPRASAATSASNPNVGTRFTATESLTPPALQPLSPPPKNLTTATVQKPAAPSNNRPVVTGVVQANTPLQSLQPPGTMTLSPPRTSGVQTRVEPLQWTAANVANNRTPTLTASTQVPPASSSNAAAQASDRERSTLMLQAGESRSSQPAFSQVPPGYRLALVPENDNSATTLPAPAGIDSTYAEAVTTPGAMLAPAQGAPSNVISAESMSSSGFDNAMSSRSVLEPSPGGNENFNQAYQQVPAPSPAPDSAPSSGPTSGGADIANAWNQNAPNGQTGATSTMVLPLNNPQAVQNSDAVGQVVIASANEPVWRFNFQNAPWPVVIRSFAKQNGMALQMQIEPPGQFSFVDERDYTFTEALDLLNDYLLAQGALMVRNGTKLTVVSSGAPLQEGIVPFVSLSQILALGRNELASVAIPIRSAEATVVLTEVQPLLSRLGKAQLVSNSSRIIVTDTGAYLRRARDILGGHGLAASDVQTIVFHLRNTTAESVAATIMQQLGVGVSASVETNGAPVQTASFTSSTSSAKVIGDRETNSLLISGTPEEVANIQSLVCQLDQARAQVVLQGLILEVNLGNVKELGAELGLQDSVLFNRSVVDNLVTLSQTNTAANGVQTTNQQVVSQTAAPGFNFNNQALGNNVAISPNVIGTQGLGNLGVGRVNNQLGFGGLVLSASSNSVSLLLRALQANYEVDVLSRPQIRTVDDKEAFIQIGQQVPVVDGVTITANGNANPIVRQDQAGIILKMTPHVSPDGLIQIKVIAEKSAFKLAPGTGVPIFTDARNGTVIQAPVKDITTAQATVSARAGQTIVLGGMITREDETIERRVPGLSRIPLVGRLFRYDYNNTVRKELLIFLTPQLITNDLDSEVFKEVELGRVHAPLDRATEIHGDLLPVTDRQ